MPIAMKGNVEIPVLPPDANGNYLQPFIYDKVVTKNENIIILMTGRPRCGKSNNSIWLAERLREYGFKFGGVDDIATGTEEFIRILRRAPEAGQVIVYEEAPVGHSSRKWFSKQNEAMNDILNTFGYLNGVWILNGVNFSDLDNRARKLIHLNIHTQRKNEKIGKSYAKAYWLSWDDWKGEPIRSRLWDNDSHPLTFAFGNVRDRYPQLWNDYMDKKKKWNIERLKYFQQKLAEDIKDPVERYYATYGREV